MKVRVLGCSGAIAAGDRTTSFLIDDDLLIGQCVDHGNFARFSRHHKSFARA